MKPTKINYILFLFAKHEKQDMFITGIAEELSVVSDSENIKFYYGPESGIFTFQSTDDFQTIHEYMNIIFEGMSLAYFLLPFKHDTMSVGLQMDIYKHLFNESNGENMSGKGVSVQKMLNDKFKEVDFEKLFSELDTDEDDDDEIKKIKSKEPKPSLDDLLEKIKDEGMSSLTKKELSLLEKYSK